MGNYNDNGNNNEEDNNNNENKHQDVHLFTQILNDNTTTSTTKKTTVNRNGSHDSNEQYSTTFPLRSSKDKVGEYKITPIIHAGYAFTWFGLSSAGVIMTRKLFTRGR